MDNFNNLYDFIELAKTNRKYPINTANNLKSALKIFEKELNPYELKSIHMIEESIEEIFRSVAIANKHKSIISLNTYKARLLKVINDYKKYGADPGKIKDWQIKTKKSTALLTNKDKTDKENIKLSDFIYDPVENLHKIELSLDSGNRAVIHLPKNFSKKDAELLKSVIDSLAKGG